MSRVKITDTTLRDGHQSLWATRMRVEDMLPVAKMLDKIGFHSLEVWGGATFDVCLRYLNEDPWERLRLLKEYVSNTPLQMLLRGQSLVGYQHYPDDMVEKFVHKSVENGIDIIRIFDALNDTKNMEVPIRAGLDAGAHIQASIVYTLSPVHTMDNYLKNAVRLAELGAHSICIKDMAGLLSPHKAHELVKLLKEKLGLPVQLHCHYTGGMAVGAYMKGAEAGVDVIDTASFPLSFGTSQPPVETLVRIFQDSNYDTGLDLHALFDIAEKFEQMRIKYGKDRGVTRLSDVRVFDHQVPGGMISNLDAQLKEQKATDKLPQVLDEIPRVRKELGYPPLVTPTSQIVGTQAVLNVLIGERYKMVPGEVKAYVKGLYGCPPAPVDKEVMKRILKDEKPFEGRPADLLEPVMERIYEEASHLAESEEDYLSYAMFPQVGGKFLKARKDGEVNSISEINTGSVSPGKEDEDMEISHVKELVQLINQTDVSELSLEDNGVRIFIRKGTVGSSDINASSSMEKDLAKTDSTEKGKTEGKKQVAEKQVKETVEQQDGISINAPMVGTFYRAPAPDAAPFVEIGDRVEKGQTLCILEAMKLFNEIEAETAGVIVDITVENAEPVEYGQPLFIIKKD
ncbi:MAG: acetyl-CoA carboxylase biotin carboxyl carrier protein [Clostridiales bacterium]|nr:acetyl-CoA carboxylase biotin carboxyl carrier protein [Clostridiales bacterium]MCF8022222.1 acetyl-CoA carboxylase biotin carboxyl carrier protein [Clostridiales bacterium]